MRSVGAQTIMLLVLVTLLWLLFLCARVWTTPVALGLWLLLTAVVARGLFLRARLRRRAWLQMYLHPASALVPRLGGGPLLMGMQTVLAAALALLLMVTMAGGSHPQMWFWLIGSALLLPSLACGLERVLAAQANPALLAELAWRLSGVIVGVGLLLAFTLQAYVQSYPDFSAVSLEQAVWHLAGQQQARSEATLAVLQGAAAAEGVRLWLAQQLLPTPAESLWQALGWVLLLAQEALFIWSYLLACRGIVMLHSAGSSVHRLHTREGESIENTHAESL